MRGMLNAMGVTLWAAIAVTLAAAVAVLGYRASLSYRSVYPTTLTRTKSLPPQQPTAARSPPLRATGGRRGQAAIQKSSSATPMVAALDPSLDTTPESLSDEPPLIGHYVRPANSDPRFISRVIAKEMTAAQKALQAQQWQEALRNLKAAQGDFEKALATGNATPEETVQWTKTLFSIAASTGQYQKAIDYGKTMVDNGTATNDNLAIIAQSYYLLKDCKNSGIWADKAIAAARKAGETPKENLYLFKLQCASDSGDTAAMDAVLMDLIKLNNKTSYWNTLLRIERQDARDDHNTLMIYRIMYNTNSMNADTDYIEMAQLLGDAALPGEAAAVLDEAMAGGIIKDEHKERTNRLLTALKGRADSDKNSLLQEEVEAKQNPTGELLVELGEVYYGFGDYQRTIDAINQGMQKGQVTQTEQALVYLGLAQMQLKSYAEAKKTFASIPAAPNVSARSARLWRLYAATLYAG